MTDQSPNTIVSAARLGEVLGIGDRWVRELADQGFIVKAGYGEYALEASVQGYIRFVRESEVGKVSDTAARSRELFEAERARKLKLDNDTREALLTETETAIVALDIIVGTIRTGLSGVAARVTDDVAERRRIDDEIDTVLRDLAGKFEQAGAALREGRDPLEAEAADIA